MHTQNGFTGNPRLDLIIVELSEAYGFHWLKEVLCETKERLSDIQNYIFEHKTHDLSEKVIVAIESDKECSVTLRRNGNCIKKSIFVGYI